MITTTEALFILLLMSHFFFNSVFKADTDNEQFLLSLLFHKLLEAFRIGSLNHKSLTIY